MARKVVKKKSLKKKFNFPKKYLLFILGVLAFGVILYFWARLFFVASVNSRLISRFSVIKELEKRGGKTTLDAIILKTLVSQEAKKRKITISKEELNAELKKIESNIASQGATLEDLLNQQGITRKDLEDQVGLQLLVSKLVDNKVTVTDAEIEEYLSFAPDLTKEQAKEAISQQKLQEKIEAFLADLKSKAKINYFKKY